MHIKLPLFQFLKYCTDYFLLIQNYIVILRYGNYENNWFLNRN